MPLTGGGREYERKNSLPDGDDDFLPPLTLMTQQRSVTYGDLVDGHHPNINPVLSEVRIIHIQAPINWGLRMVSVLTSINSFILFDKSGL